ncbi:hypothetical protein PRIPAC_93048 [Pristionchus pacificus]|uniref:Serpentine receptor class gamma n=1 Tax=Pristionchus pacificus TaxID=54126 RepID=A0A2A6BRD3_PRIPA|nr:hypothetical protein PRIPAC_93048 [Pristionchus pacificus]|eukprot:PDM68311.1 G protein-coupled receptor [Pristionchus pacificus]
MTWGTAIPDAVLALLYVYLLIRLATSPDRYFKKPFYTLFIATGVYSVTSVVSFLCIAQFAYAEKYGTEFIYKIFFAVNSFGANGATFGKAIIAIHRFFVMKNRDFYEQKWSRSMILRILIVQFVFSATLVSAVWPASYVYNNGAIAILSKDHMLVLKACSFAMYVVYLICIGIFTVLTSRELFRLGHAREGSAEIRSIMVYQSRMFIIVTFTTFIATYLDMSDLVKTMILVYPIINGLATYAAPVCLVWFSSRVQARLFCFYRRALSVPEWSGILLCAYVSLIVLCQTCNYRRYGVKNPILHPICHSLPTLSHLRIQTALISTTFSISMTVWAEVIPDLVLAALYSYLLIRLATSSDIFFKTPFYTLFITTGVYSIISVISFIVMTQFHYTEHYWTVYIYKTVYALNVFGACGATIGKAFIAIHRYVVMKNQDFTEKKWSGKIINIFLITQFVISAVRTAPVWPASYSYQKGAIVALSKNHTLVLKAFSVSTYVLYIICNGIFTTLTFRELIRLQKDLKGVATMQKIMVTQRNLFIVVTVCSVSYLIKALHQFAIAVSTFLSLDELFKHLSATYPIVNGFATYAAPVCLVLCSSITYHFAPFERVFQRDLVYFLSTKVKIEIGLKEIVRQQISYRIMPFLIFETNLISARIPPIAFRKNLFHTHKHEANQSHSPDVSMTEWGEVIPDISLAILYSYMLARLATSSETTFKTPFYTLFITTGIYSIISVISFIVFSQFYYTEHYWTVYIYKITYWQIIWFEYQALNVFSACGATLGKAFIAIHRLFVMSTQDFSEKASIFWSGPVLQRFLVIQFAISVIRTAPVWPASYVYQDNAIVALSKDHTLACILKVFTVSTYALYILCNGICTGLTCRELIKLRRSEKGVSTMRLIMTTQRNLFIVVTVCSVSHLIKALHQFGLAVSTYFSMQDLYNVLYPTYPIVNGLATYAAPVCLIICSPIVRSRLFTFTQCSKKNSSISAYTR